MNTHDIYEEAYQVGKEIIAASAKPDVENTPEQYRVQQRKAKRAFKLRPDSKEVATQRRVFSEAVVNSVADDGYSTGVKVLFSSHAEVLDLLSFAADNNISVTVGVGLYKGQREVSYTSSLSGFISLLAAGYLVGQETVVIECGLSSGRTRGVLVGLNCTLAVPLGMRGRLVRFSPADAPEAGTILLHHTSDVYIMTYE